MLTKELIAGMDGTIRTLLGPDNPTFIFMAGDKSGVYVLSNCASKEDVGTLLQSLAEHMSNAADVEPGSLQ